MSDLLLLEPGELGKACIERPLDALIQELRDLPWPEPGKPVVGPASAFQVASGSLRVTDPAKRHDEECAGTITGVKNGKWYACVQSEHYGPDIEAGRMWHGKRIDEILQTQEENKDYAMVRHLLVTYLCDAIRTYKARALSCGPLNFLHIQHVSYKQALSDSLDGFEQLPFTIDVENGMAGFFDLDWFLSKHPTPAPGPFSLAWFENVDPEDAYSVETVWKEFYDMVCELTPDSTRFGTCEQAAVAYGTNGGYTCYIKRDEAGEVICARIVFQENSD